MSRFDAKTAMYRQRLLFISNSSMAFLNHHLPLAEAMREELETYVAVACDGDDDVRRIEERGITVHPIRWTRKTANPFRIAAEALVLRRIIASVKPDVVNAINIKSLLVTALAMAFPTTISARLVGTILGLGYMFSDDSMKRRLLRSMAMAAMRRALPRLQHTLIFSNADDQQLFFSCHIGKPDCACIVPVPGVDTEAYAYSPEPTDGFRVILPARMLWEKGVGEFVEAAKLLRQSGINADCVLAGGIDTGNPTAIDAQQLQEWNEEGTVRWIGHQNNMPALLASAHVVCLPSYYREGFPRVLSEAMACGRAVVTTDVPGCRDAVMNLGTGLLIPPRNVAALVNALKALWIDPTMRREMGLRGRQTVLERFSQETITNAMRDVLTDVESEFKHVYAPQGFNNRTCLRNGVESAGMSGFAHRAKSARQ
jgi:glycosyltransferase involved in cell wall biosynthesis